MDDNEYKEFIKSVVAEFSDDEPSPEQIDKNLYRLGEANNGNVGHELMINQICAN